MAFNVGDIGKPAEPVVDVPKIYSDRYKHSIVDSQYNPSQNLLTMVSGIPRLCEYYRGVYGESEEPRAFQPSDINTYQSYTRIKNLVIKEQGQGSYNFDAQTGTSTGTYSAYVLFDLVPIKGDVLIMDIGDGNAGLFTVQEQPEIFNITSDKCYLIQYQFLEILRTDIFEMLDARVVEESVYTKDSVLNGGNAVISQGTFDTQKDLLEWRQVIASNILNQFYWNNEKTIAYYENTDPSTPPTEYYYDPYLVEFLCGILTPELRGRYTFIEQINIQYGMRQIGNKGTFNIWEVIKTRNFNLLPMCTSKITAIDPVRVYNSRYYGNIRNTKFTHLLVTNPEDYLRFPGVYDTTKTPRVVGRGDVEMDYFISESFYEGTPVGEFESILVDTLKENIFDRKRILEYCKTYFNLTPKEQLYQGAVLLYIIQLSRKVNVGL